MRASVTARIEELKALRDAIILAHNYQLPAVQDVADFVGDSLELSRKAASSGAEVVVFCGVYFMAETACILCPDKTVLIPDPEARCPMAAMCSATEVKALKEQHPDALVVAYVNSSAAVKAESDWCCTSANAARIVASLDPGRPVIFVPDQYLGSYVEEQTGRKLILDHGYCPTHARILEEDIEQLLGEHPAAEVMAHPECRPGVRGLAHYVGSTSGMCRRARESEAREFIVATEVGLTHRLRHENPGKRFYVTSGAAVCANMKKISLENILWALEEMKCEVTVPAATREAALQSVRRMTEADRCPANGRALHAG